MMNNLPRKPGKLPQNLSDLEMDDLFNPFQVVKKLLADTEQWMDAGAWQGMIEQFTNQVQMEEMDHAYQISVKLEGVERPEDIQVQLFQNQLHISRIVEQQIKQDTDQVKLWKTFQERFERMVTLPSPVNWHARSITVQDGVWTIILPKV